MIERYTRPAMGALWTQESRFAAWLEVELAVCEAWKHFGAIDQESLDIIRQKARIDVPRILEIEETTRHDVIAFLTSLEEQVGEPARFIHLGCTSSDIVDTANALLLVRAGRMILDDIDNLLHVLKTMAYEYKGRPVMGRTHGIHAEPTSFGLKLAGFYAEMTRHKARVAAAVEGVRVGKISGAVGTYALVDPKIEAKTCEILGLEVDPHSTQIVQRDRHATFMTSLGLLAGGVERLAVELRHLQRTEVREIEEGFSKGQKGSSAMPHKKNPISAENLSGLARLVRTNSLASMENQALWHERDISHSSVERVIFPDSTILVDYMLSRMTKLVGNLRILPENMDRNLELSHGLFYSQRVLTALVEAGVPRQEAYVMVQAVAMQCWNEKRSFVEAVKADPAIVAKLGPGALDNLMDISYYLRYEDTIFDRVFKD